MHQIFVVSNDGDGLSAMLSVFEHAGYRATGASTFQEAQQRLTTESPDLIIADERLGDFNGLHVLLTALAKLPHAGAIVTTPVKNRGLEADARSLNVHCMVKPKNPAEWLAPVSTVLMTAAVSNVLMTAAQVA
jgi:two-component system response regulator HydG